MPESSVSRLMDAMDALVDGIYIVGENMVVEYMNRSMIKLFGEGVGRKCHEVISGQDKICPWCCHKEVIGAGLERHTEAYIPRIGRTFSLVGLPVVNKDGSRSLLSTYRDITQSRQQAADLRSSEENYKRLFKTVGCGVFTSSAHGRFLDANPALLKMLGYDDKQEFLSLDLATGLYLRPEDRDRYREVIEKQGSVVDYEVEWKKKDGSIVYALLTSNVRYDSKGEIVGYEGIVVDQTERKNIEHKMREALDFLDKTIQCSPNAIMAADLKGNVIIWNNSAEKILGHRAEDVIGKMKIYDIYPEGLAHRVMKMLRSNDYGGKGILNSYPLLFKKQNGDDVEGNLSASILYDEEGKEIASVGILMDIGERLNMERTLSETRQQLLHSERLAAMGRLTSQIAHELNNPLFGIMNTLELMKTEIPPTNKRRKLLDMSISEIERLADMLKKMLTFSKPEEANKIKVDIHSAIEDILLFYEKRFRENNIKIKKDFAPDPAIVLASRDQLRQVFINIISNAMDAMPERGTLSISTNIRNNNAVVVAITDTGIGIKPENIGKIFDSFFTTKKDSVKGVGLGLSVCYGFIKDMDGDIQVQSKPGEGATFIITLPLCREEK
jgi:PAS domain S-box-containing protein